MDIKGPVLIFLWALAGLRVQGAADGEVFGTAREWLAVYP